MRAKALALKDRLKEGDQTHVVSVVRLSVFGTGREPLRGELNRDRSHRQAIRRVHQTGQADRDKAVRAVHVRK